MEHTSTPLPPSGAPALDDRTMHLLLERLEAGEPDLAVVALSEGLPAPSETPVKGLPDSSTREVRRAVRKALLKAVRASDGVLASSLLLSLRAAEVEMPQVRGRLIAFEGVDGSGKTTLAKAVRDALARGGVPVTYTCLPSPQGRAAVEAAPDPCLREIRFQADRARHASGYVEGCLSMGQDVVVDRWSASSFAYAAPDVRDDVLAIATATSQRPDLTVWVDTPLETCLERLSQRRGGDNEDALDPSTSEALRGAQKGYEDLLGHAPGRASVLRLDGSAPVEPLVRVVLDALRARCVV